MLNLEKFNSKGTNFSSSAFKDLNFYLFFKDLNLRVHPFLKVPIAFKGLYKFFFTKKNFLNAHQGLLFFLLPYLNSAFELSSSTSSTLNFTL